MRARLFSLLILLLLGAAALLKPDILSAETLGEILRSYSWMAILACGLLFILQAGDLDLSFMAVTAVCQYTLAALLEAFPAMPGFLYFLVPLTTGFLLGSLNALLIHLLRAPAVLITIATQGIFYGTLILFSGGRYLYRFPEGFRRLATGGTGPFSLPALLWLGVFLTTYLLQKHSSLGLKISAVGNHPEAAARIGISPGRVRWFAFGYGGALCGLAANMQMALVQTVSPGGLIGRELEIIAAVVLGGASLSKGTGSAAGVFTGMLLIALSSSLLSWFRIPAEWDRVFIGLIILTGVIANALHRRRIAYA